MGMNITSLVSAAAIVFATLSASADVKITGSTSFKFGPQNTTVTITCGGINNTSRENATGTLKMELWALNSPYSSGTISGVLLTDYKLDGLNPGSVYNNVQKTLNAVVPKTRKPYYLCLVVAEYRKGGYVIADYRNYTGTTTLGPLALFSMSGPWQWKTSAEGGTVDIAVGKISHTRTGHTGELNVAVWATLRPYNGGNIQGYKLGEVKKDPLQPGFAYTDLKNTAKYKAPPPGSYYVSIVLSEFNNGAYMIQAHLGSASPSVFK